MNHAVGFSCPVCDCDDAELRGYERNEDEKIVGIRLTCLRCGHEWRQGL